MRGRADAAAEEGGTGVYPDLSFPGGQDRQKRVPRDERGVHLSQELSRLRLREETGNRTCEQKTAHGIRRGAKIQSEKHERKVADRPESRMNGKLREYDDKENEHG